MHGVLAQRDASPTWGLTGERVITGGAALVVIALVPLFREQDGLDAARLWAQGALFVVLTAVAAEFVLLAERVPDRFGHFQTALSLGCVLAGFAGLYHGVGRVFGRSMREVWGRAHFATGFVGVNLALLPAHIVTIAPGLAGPMPSASFRTMHAIGTGLVLLSLLVFVIRLAEAVPWGDGAADPHTAERFARPGPGRRQRNV